MSDNVLHDWKEAAGSFTAVPPNYQLQGGESAATEYGLPAIPGMVIEVESGGVFAAGDLLETTSIGRVVLRSSGIVVGRALEAAGGAGQTKRMTFTN